MLLLPTVKAEKVYLIDPDVAKYFFFTEQYYPALEKELERDIKAMEEVLSRPAFSRTKSAAAVKVLATFQSASVFRRRWARV